MNIIYEQSDIDKISSYDDSFEIEFRFGKFEWKGNKKYFRPEIRNSDFIRINEYMKNLTQSDGEKTCSIVDISDSGIRRIQTMNLENTEIVFEKKEKIYEMDLDEYDMRISISSEELTQNKNFISSYQRIRERITFNVENKYKVDITKILQTNFGENVKYPCNQVSSKNTYELEVELLNKKYISEFFEFSSKLYLVLKQTRNYYTRKDVESMKSDIGALINNQYYMDHMKPGLDKHNIYKQTLVVARNLKLRDLIYDGIIKGKGAPYYVSFKADGLRKMLIVHSTGIWLHFPPYESNLLIKAGENQQFDNIIKKFNGSVFDGEQVKLFDKQAEFEYLIFDCIHTCTTIKQTKCTDLYNKKYEQRLQTCQVFEKHLNEVQQNPKILFVKTKDAIKIENETEYFKIINNLLDSKDKLNFKEDGLTFTPGNDYYNPFTKIEKEKSLAKNSDVCKWKPIEELTIDFQIQKTNDGKIIPNVTKSVNGVFKSVPFKGTNKYPFYDYMLDHTNSLTKDLPSGFIIEYRTVFKDGHPFLVPKGIREDKESPNPDYVAEDVWEDIMEPITEETLRGKNMVLVDNYHKNIKKTLLKEIKSRDPILHLHSGDFNEKYHNDIFENKTKLCVENDTAQFHKLLEQEPNSINANIHNHTLVKKYSSALLGDAKALVFFADRKIDGSIDYLDLNDLLSGDKSGLMYTFSDLSKESKLVLMAPSLDVSVLKTIFNKLGFYGAFKYANEEKLLTEKQKIYSNKFVYGMLVKRNDIQQKESDANLIKDFLEMYGNLTNYVVVLDYKNDDIFERNDNFIYLNKLKNKDIKKLSRMQFLLICKEGYQNTEQFKMIKPLKYLAL